MKKKVVFIIIVMGSLNVVALILFAFNIICLNSALIILVANIANIILAIYHFSTVKLLMNKTIKDQFTQIYNKNYFEEILNQKVDYSNRSKENLSLIMFDIDDFKNVNDKYGHPMGDKVLLELTKIVSNHIRSYDIFSRIGGEEFTIIMSSTTYQEVTETAERIRNKIQLINIEGIKITISIGVSCLNKTNNTAEKLYQSADEAMYMSKNTGKNRIHFPSNFSI